MSPFWTRTRTFLITMWTAVIVAEVLVILAIQRINNSWLLLLFAAILAVPLIAMDRTLGWIRRPKRTRWKRHDLPADGIGVSGMGSREVTRPKPPVGEG